MAKRKIFNREAWIKRYLSRALDRMWGWYPLRKQAKDATFVRVTDAGADLHQCPVCLEEKLREEIQVDHVEPTVPTDGRALSWGEMIDRRLVRELGELQAKCKDCHLVKTIGENKTRSEAKRARKKSRD